MKKLTFECRIITPMFLNGADGKTPELRVPSIKGAMRFWWRAMNGHLGLQELKEREAAIFGNTSCKSSFNILVRQLTQQLNIKSEKVLPHRDKSFYKEAIQPHEVFEISFLYRNNTTRKLIENLFPLSCVFGGWGGRSRRGYGSVKILNNSYPVTLTEVHKLLQQITPGLYSILPNGKEIVSRIHPKPDYPFIEKIEIGRTNVNLIRKINQATHDVKQRYGFDYNDAAGSASPRFASPVYISIIETASGLQPLIVTLYNTKKRTKQVYKIQDELKGKIL